MRVLFLEHDHASPPGPIAERFTELGYHIDRQIIVPATHYYSPNVTFDFPDPTDFDAIVVMGAPWGAWDVSTIGNWLLPEIEWLQDADKSEIPVMGICFGGQLLARTHGGSVARAPRAEIGFSTVWSDIPEINGQWFQYHFDRWVTPPAATELARNSLAPQAFSLRRNLALQFHPEVTSSILRTWLDVTGDKDIVNDSQDPAILMAHLAANDAQTTRRAHALVDYFIKNFANPPRMTP
jgi:GMP synthase-like glutamine amidotransferase